MTVHNNVSEPWKVTLVDTGLDTMTGGRIKRVAKYIGNERFMLTYGDAVSDVDINKLLEFHNAHGKLATITAISVSERFGVLEIDENDNIEAFREKTEADSSCISGGFMVLEPEIFDYIEGDNTVFEKGPLKQLAAKGELKAYKHEGFWQCMDTKREHDKLEEMWKSKNAPWKLWE